ncbi:P-loop NTPase [candidate division KSB1 bacterium]
MDNGFQNNNGKDSVVGNNTATILAIAGGKGGTGKSVMSANLGISLANLGLRVILIDGDLGGANLHTVLNIKHPKYNLNDFLTNEKTHLKDILLDTPARTLKLISGGSELVGIANIQHYKKLKLLRHILQLPADYIIVDLGAGQSYNTLDFFNLSNEGIIITNPEPTAKLDAYSFIKNVVYRKVLSIFKKDTAVFKLIKQLLIDERHKSFQLPRLPMIISQNYPKEGKMVASILQSFRPKLIMNKVRRSSQIHEGTQLVTLAGEYLGISLKYLGHIENDQKVVDATEIMMPFVLKYPRSRASQDLYKIINSLGITDNGSPIKHFYQFKKGMKAQAKEWK